MSELLEGCFLYKNLPVVNLGETLIIYDYFKKNIVQVSKEDFLNGKLPELSFNQVPNKKEVNPEKSVLTIILNKSCNMRCVYCFADGGDCKSVISKDCIREAIKYAIKPETKQLFLTFFGGEPTLCYDEIEFAINESKKYPIKMKYAISTNGVMDERTLDLLIKNKVAFNLSMDGLPEIQDKQRPLIGNRPSSEAVERTIKRLVQNKSSFKVRATITKESLEFMPKMIEYLSNLGVKFIHLEAVNIAGRAKKAGIEKPSAESFVKKFTECLDLAKKYGVTLVNGIYTNLNNPSVHSCSAVTGKKIIVTPNGEISRCYEVQEKTHPYASQFIIGEFDKKEKKFILDEKKIKNLELKDCNSAKECQDCFAKYICSGGCVMRNMHGLNSSDIKAVDPYQCEIIKGLLKDAILRIAEKSIKNDIRLLKKEELNKVMPWMLEMAKKSFGFVDKDILNKSINESYEKYPEGFVVYEKDKEIIGLLWFEIDSKKKSGYIHAIYVREDYRGKGISQKIMKYLKDICKKKEIREIGLNVSVTMEDAIKFYKKEGFKIKRYQMTFDPNENN